MPATQISPSEDPRREDAPEQSSAGGPPLSREEILAIDDRPMEAVAVPEWGGRTVYIRTISALERDYWDVHLLEHTVEEDEEEAEERGARQPARRLKPCNLRATLVALCAADAEGNRLFGIEDAEALAGKSGAAIDRLYDVARRLNKVSQADVEELKKTSAGTATS